MLVEADHLQAGAVDEERNAVQIAHADEVGAVLDQRDEPLALGLGALAVGDVAHDLRRPDDAAVVVFDGRDRERDQDALAVRPHALGLEVLDPLPGFQAGDDVIFLGDAIGGDDQGDVAADGLLGRVAEQTFGRRVPALNDPVERLADDRVVR